MLFNKHITQYSRQGNFYLRAVFLLVLCCFSANAVVSQAYPLDDQCIELMEGSESESQETSEEETSDSEEDPDPCHELRAAIELAIQTMSKTTVSEYFLVKNAREKVSTPPPEQV